MRLLSGTKLLSHIPLDMEGGVRSCDVTNSYAVILLVSGTIALLELQEGVYEDDATLKLSWPELGKGSKVNLISTYTDYSGIFGSKGGAKEAGSAHKTTPTTVVSKTLAEEEEELLYGSIERLVQSNKKSELVEFYMCIRIHVHVGCSFPLFLTLLSL